MAADAVRPINEYAPAWRPANKDDLSLRLAFDDGHYWRSISNTALQTKKVGLVGNVFLDDANGWEIYAMTCITKCRKLVQKISRASTIDEYRAMARDMDRVSDLLCRVIDLSDFMRTIHDDSQIIDACTRSYELGYKFMNMMNTTSKLHVQLQKALNIPEVVSSWSVQEKKVAQMLVQDFAKSAIDRGGIKKQRFVSLSSEIADIGPKFVKEMEPAEQSLIFKRNELHGLDPTIISKLSTFTGKVKIPLFTNEAYLALQTVNDPAVRQKLYMGLRKSSSNQLVRLNDMLQKRAELAELCGFSNYATMNLQDKMAKSPEAVQKFLTALSATNRPQLQSELAELATIQAQTAPSRNSLAPWDHAYYLTKHLRSTSSPASRLTDNLSSYFSVGTVIEGLSRLFDRLYGFRLVPVPVAKGEVWQEDVRRLDVVSESDGLIGVIYCDLFAREDKMRNPTHFTLRCSREITSSEISECDALGQHPNDGLPTTIAPSSISGQPALHQLPVIALVCDFDLPPSKGTTFQSPPACMSIQEMTTLYHEMGHAVHSLLARTSLQSISGTRCATDFSELPSIIMEHFALDPSILTSFGRHWETGASPPPEAISRMLASRRHRTESNRHWNTQIQVCMAMLDQECHAQPASKPIDSTALYQEVWTEHAALAEPQGSSWHGFFGHLFTYGSSYYAYLFDTAIAKRVWEETFQSGAHEGGLKRENGERFKEEVLRWGGGRDGWTCLEGLLGKGEGVLAEGGDRAMKVVGEWGAGRLGSDE